MTLRASPILLTFAALSLAACGSPEEPASAPPADAAAGAAASSDQAAAPATFDLSAVPVSTATLAPYPYLAVPAGYRAEDSGDIRGALFPIWLGSGFQTVEGDVHWTRIGTELGQTLSRTQVQRGFDDAVAAAGGVRIASGDIPQSAYTALPEAMRLELLSALGDLGNSPATTYVIRRADRTIWVHAVVSIEVAYLSIIDAPPTPTA